MYHEAIFFSKHDHSNKKIEKCQLINKAKTRAEFTFLN